MNSLGGWPRARKAAYGPEQVQQAAEFGAIERLLVLDDRLQKERGPDGEWAISVDDIVRTTEQKGGDVTVFSSEFPPGQQLSISAGSRHCFGTASSSDATTGRLRYSTCTSSLASISWISTEANSEPELQNAVSLPSPITLRRMLSSSTITIRPDRSSSDRCGGGRSTTTFSMSAKRS